MAAQRDSALLPLPERRRRRIVPLMAVGAVALIAGWIMDIGFVWGLGAGMIGTGLIALWLDRRARSRQAP